MKIVQLLPELNEGGVERGTVELSREMVKQGIDSIVISAGGKLAEQIEKDGGRHIVFDVCSKNPLTAPLRIRQLRKLLQKISPDVLHARSRVPAWLTYLANKKLKIPFVTTVHGLNRVNKYSKIMTRGDRVITVSEVVRDYIVLNYAVPDSKIRVIQRGVDLNKFDSRNIDTEFIAEFKHKYSLENCFIVASVGRITWLKDYETFIRAIAHLKKYIPTIMGIIVGGAREDKLAYLESLKTLAKENDIEDRIVFAGSQNQIAEIYFLSDVLVNASLKMGNIGRTIVESFAMDTPVIATTYEGLTNLVEDGVNGYLINTQNYLDLAEKIRLVSRGDFVNLRENLNPEYSLTTMVERTLATYRELL
ncbi:MAG: glycosyltransferase family 4 protein [Desulfuromusa sp.]